MKKFLLTLTILFSAFFNYAQDNPSSAAALLNVPQEFTKYNGQIQKKVQYQLTEYRTIDFTNVDTINGKLVRKIDTTYSYSTVPVIENFGSYSLNILSNYINDYGYSVTSDSTLFKPSMWATTPVGQFIGETYFHGWSNVILSPASGGYNFEVISYPYMNTETNGLPAITPWLSIKQINKTITGSVSISQKRFTVTKTNVRTTTTRPINVRYTKDHIEQQSGLSEEKIGEMTKTVFQIFSTSGNTHGNSIATSIQKSGNTFKGIAYINGIDLNQLNYKNLMAPFFQKYGGYVNRWRLHNGSSNSVSFGSTWMKQLESNQPTDLIIVAGSSFSYNSATNTLTYDANKPAELWFQTEFLPAQGKQTVWETRMNLATGEVIWK